MSHIRTINKRNIRALGVVFGESKIRSRGKGSPTLASRFLSYPIGLASPTEIDRALKLGAPLALASASRNVRLARHYDRIIVEFELPSNEWTTYDRSSLRSSRSIGVGPGGREVPFEWGESHFLFGGSSGSGKTVAIHGAIEALVNTYSSSELRLLIGTPHDKKDDWSAFAGLPHLAAPLATVDSIEGLIDMAYRIYKTREQSGSDGTKIAVVLDEIQHENVLGSKEEKTLRRDQIRKVAQMARGSRGFDMRLLLGSQRPSQADMPGILDNLRTRFVGAVTDASIAAQVTGLPGTSAAGLTGSGDFLYVNRGSALRFQVAYPDDLALLPSGPMNPIPIPALREAIKTAVDKTVEIDGDWELLGRIIAYILIKRSLPGRNTGKRNFDMDHRAIKSFKDGFMRQSRFLHERGTAVDRRVGGWLQSWIGNSYQ